MTDEEVKFEAEKHLAFWQPYLHLMDWEIIIEVPPWGLTDSVATNEFNAIYCKSIITIRNPNLHRPSSWGSSDIEESLVHELVHLHFFTVEPDEANGVNYHFFERAIDRMALALVKLKREGTTKDWTIKHASQKGKKQSDNKQEHQGDGKIWPSTRTGCSSSTAHSTSKRQR